MVSPTCPYCPPRVRTAHKFAMINDHIVGDMVEISEFRSSRKSTTCKACPKPSSTKKWDVVGAAPEQQFLAKSRKRSPAETAFDIERARMV
jgi:hypothetical protein